MLCVPVATLCATVTGSTQDRIEPDGSYDVATMDSGTAYAAVAATTDDRVEVVNPLTHWPVASNTNGVTAGRKTYGEHNGPDSIATPGFASKTYAPVAEFNDNGVPSIGVEGPLTLDAGQDQAVDEAETVILSGTASDPEKDLLTHQRTHDSSLAVARAHDTAPSTSITAPAVTADTTVTFTIADSETPAGAAGQVRTLDSLTLSDVNIGEFLSDTTHYTGLAAARVAHTTVTATPTDAAAAVTITDADGSTDGTTRASSLAVGANEITVTVTSADGKSVRTYRVTVTRPQTLWGDRLPELDIALDAVSRPTAIWGSAETLWVGAWGEYDVYAYDFQGARVPDLDLNLATGGYPIGMWSDGTTLWVADHFSGVLAHSLADGSRVPDKDFDDATASADNDAANGLWSDGTTMWIADRVDSKIYTYGLSDKARAEDAEFSLLSVEGLKPSGLWSDGTMMLTASWLQGKVYAFRLPDGTPLPAMTIDAGASGNTKPFGLWSDGETMWVVDDAAQKAFAYAVPGLSGSLAEVSIAADASPVSEGTPAAFTLRRSGDAAEALLVSVSVSESGEMTAPDLPTEARFAAGSTTAVLRVGTTDDAVAEASSLVTAALAPGTGYAVSPDAGSEEVLVEDDDGATWEVVAAPVWLAEGDAATVTVSVTNGWTFAADQTLTLTTSGAASADDYALRPTSLTLPAGDASVSATLTATDDATSEGYETVTVSAARGGATLGTATLTITANDGPSAPSVRGRIPARTYPSNELYTKISPQLGARQHNQPTVINGHLLLAGNGVHAFWDISDPYSPVKVSEFSSPHRFGEAESHQVSYARFGNGSLHLATVSGRGIDLWGIDNLYAPRLLSAIELPNINYGDVHNAVWGIAWQGDYIYVGATTSGLYIVDAADPAQPRLVDTIPSSELGGVAAGPLFALGNLLVVTTPKTHAGVVTMDISDPADPVLLDFVKPRRASYIGAFYGRNAHLQTPFRTYDVTTDPRDIRETGSDTTPASEYMSFGDGHLFLGGLRGSSSGIWKYDIADPDDLRLIGHIPGRDRRWDDQFSIPIGNLIAISDDQNVDGYVGSYIAVHDTEPDTRPPLVDYVNPPDGAVDQAISSRIGLSFSDQIEFASVDPSSLVVRPLGGQALPGRWGHTQTVVSFWPDRPLEADTDYEIVAAAGGITDLVGNAIENEFRSVFRTGTASPRGTGGGIDALTAVQTGRDAQFAADPTPGAREYRWDFGDGRQASGSSVSHRYDTPGRFTVTLSVLAADGRDVFEAEDATLSGGVAAASDARFHFGTGYAKYPDAIGANVKIQWRIERAAAGTAAIDLRYANGGESERSLELVVNGNTIQTVAFKRTGTWSRWGVATIDDIALDAGANTVELIARNDTGPSIDRLSLPSETSTVVASYSATQVVHRPLTASAPARSSTVIVTTDRARAWAVNPDADSVTAIDTGALDKAFERSVGRTPRTLAQAPDGTIWVVNEQSHDISVLDSGDGAVIDTIGLPYASMPYGIAFAPDGSAAYVTLQALGRLLRIDPTTRTVVHSLALGPDASGIVPKVRGIAIDSDSGRILVARFVSPDEGGEIYDVEVLDQATSLTRTVALGIDRGPDTPDSGRGIPNYIGSLAISPDGVHARVPSKKDNIERGSARDGRALTHENTVRAVVSQIDLSSGHEDLGARVDLNDHDIPSALAFSPLGDLMFVATQGSNTVDVIDAYSGAGVAGLPTGRAPQGLTLDDRGRLYVQNFMGRSLSVFDVAALLRGTESSARLLAEIDLVANETLSDSVLLGKLIFYDASSRRMSLDGYLSCASCHVDGAQDGRTWDFTDRGEGLRNTISLQGRGGTLLHGPVHWTGNFDEIQDFESDIRSHFGGSGFMSDDDFDSGTRSDPLGDPKAGLSTELDALAAYVSSLTAVPPSPYRTADGSLTAQGELGRQVFANTGCDDCHGGAAFTDSAPGVRHDVGTIGAASGKRLGETLAGLDTPTLKGVWATAPYLHDGSASTLSEAVEAHSDVSLSDSALAALVSYLRQIDEFAGADGDAATWEVAVAPSEIEEADAATVTVSIANGTTFSSDQTVSLTTSGTATVDDYALEATTLTLPAGAHAMSTTLTAADDEAEEPDETVTVSAAHAGSTVGTATLTIAANDASSTDATLKALALSALDIGTFDAATTSYAAAAAESLTATAVTVTPTDADATVTITDADGSTSGTTRNVTLDYGANTITAAVTAPDGQTTMTYTVTVTRAYTPPTATIAAGTSPVTEGADASFTVRLDKAAKDALSVAVSVTETGQMLSGTASSVAIAVGDTTATLNLGTVDDSVVEDASSVTVVLGSGDGYAVGTTDSAEVSVANDDAATFAVAALPVRIDEGGAATLTVSIANGVTFTADQAVTLTVSGTATADDYTLDATTLTLPAGAGAVSATLTATDDGAEEPDETVTVTAVHGGTEIGTATVTIPANDPLSTDATVKALTLSGLDIGTFDPATTLYTATAAEPVAQTTVTVTPNDADATVTITDPSGSTAGATRNVTLDYGANTITAAVTAPDGQTTMTYTVTVTRAYTPPTATIAAGTSPVTEGADASFTVRLDKAAKDALSVAVSVTETGQMLSGTASSVAIAAGVTQTTLMLGTVDDSAVEDASTVTAALAAGDGYTLGTAASASVSVQDDDEEELSDDAALSALTLSGIDIGTFDPATTAYSADVDNAVESTTVTATPNDADATVTIADPNGSTAGTMRNVTLGYGANTIAAAVTAPDGETTKTYTVAVTRARARAPLTASVHDVPQRHDGVGDIEFELRFSEEIALSFRTLSAGYKVEGGTLRWTRRMAPPGNVRWSVAVKPAGDGELVALLPGNQTCGSAGAVCAADGRMLSNSPVARIPGPLPVVSIASDGSPVTEGTAAAFTLTRTGDATDALAVAVAVSESGTMAAADAPTEATFAAGASTAALAVATTDDAVVEASSAVTVALTPGSGYAVAADAGSAAVVVQDDDTATFKVTLSASSVAEGASATLTVSLANGVTFAETQTIGVAASGSASAADFALLVDGSALSAPYELTLAAGAAETVSTLSATDDAETEAEETVTLTASHGGTGIGAATVTIPANDPLSTDATVKALTLSGLDIGTFDPATTLYTATAAESVAQTTVTVTSNDADATVTITDPSGSTAGATRNVTLDYGANTITAAVTAPDGQTTMTYTVTVTRAYTPPTATIAAGTSPVTEGADASFTVRLDKAAKDALSVAVSVTETGQMLSGTASSVAIAAGVTQTTLRLGTVDDSVVEDASTVTAALAAGDGYTLGTAASASVSVQDDDEEELSDDAALSALTLSGIDIGVFDPATTAYSADVDNAVESTTVTATPNDADATVTIADPNGSTAGTTRTTRLAAGANAIGAVVTAADGETTATYTVTVTRAAAQSALWGERLPGKDIDLSDADRPRGLWSDGETLWVADWDNGKVLVYQLEDGSRIESRDFTLGLYAASALTSDGVTLWVAEWDGGVKAYRLSDGERLSGRDLDAATMDETGNAQPAGLWTDGQMLWVADHADGKAYAYRLSDGTRQADREFTLRADDATGYLKPLGLWSDGETVLATHWLRGTVRGYALSDGARRAGNDIGEEATANHYAAGLWSDGATLWVVDELGQKAYAYAAPGLRKPAEPSTGLVSGLSSRAMAVPGGAAAGPPVSIPDPGLRGRIAAALGKADTDTIGVHELGALVVLDARNASVADLTGLEHAVNLEGLDLGHNAVADVRPLTSLTALRRLNLDGAAPDLWALAVMDGLQALSLRSNGLDDIWALSSMNGLRVLDLADNGIDDLAALGALTSLVVLDVSENRVTDLSPLAGLQALSELQVRGNRIEYLSPLPDRAGLRILGVGEQHRRD